MLTHDSFVKAKLVEMGWRFSQSYSGGYLAGIMVMSVIANRFRLGWGSWLEIIQRIPEHMAENTIPEAVYPSVWDAGFVKLLHAVDGVYDGSAQDITKGALYWADLTKIDRSWFKSKILDAVNERTGLRQHQMISQMNSLAFFK
jgi:hypothetical protein